MRQRHDSNSVSLSRAALGMLAAVSGSFASGCASPKATVDGSVQGNVQGRFDGTIKVEGPVEVHIDGPTVKYDGTYVSQELMDKVQVGKTRGDWILAVFGEPNRRATLEDNSQIWIWSYRPVEQQEALVSVFGTSKSEPKLRPSTAFVQLRDGVVIDRWRD